MAPSYSLPIGTPSMVVLACLTSLYPLPTFSKPLEPRICSLDFHSSILGRKQESLICPPPVDEESAIDTGTWESWKRRPYCIEPLSDDAPGPQFCLYTFEPFRGNKGLSVVTTPVLAASMVDALDDTVVPPKLREHPSSSLAAEGRNDLAYVIEDIPGKGKGLVAQRPIRQWEVVLVDYPAMLAHMGLFDVVGPELREDVLDRALRQLPEEQQGDILSLARSTGGETVEDILRTNIFGVELGIEIPHLGLFPIGSRINHDCRPNVFWRYSVRTLTVEVIAMRDIEPGDEIVQSYVPLGLSYEERNEGLKNWGFACTCSLCASSKKQRAASDKNRARLHDIYHELNDSAAGKSNLTTNVIEEFVAELESLVATEKLEAQLLVHYSVVARAYMRLGELDLAKRYVELCENLWIQYAGEEEDYIAGMHQLRHEFNEREKKATIDGRRQKA
ncbi:SET domain-containing protein [Daldinia bambusicola]|nr:SET domain-containing protein [Daldinia bambusicola]